MANPMEPRAGSPYTNTPGVGIPTGNKSLTSYSVDIYNTSTGEQIGFAQSVAHTDNRTVEKIRQLNSLDAGKVVEQVPRPSDVEITVTQMALFEKDLMDFFKFNQADDNFDFLNNQFEPFTIVSAQRGKNSSGVTQEIQTIYYGCMITRTNKTWSIDKATILDSCSIQVAAVRKNRVTV